MQFEVKMRDGSTYEVDASYIEVHDGPASSSYALLGSLPGLPIAILAAFPADMVETISPVTRRRREAPQDEGSASAEEDAAPDDPASNGAAQDGAAQDGTFSQLTEDIY